MADIFGKKHEEVVLNNITYEDTKYHYPQKITKDIINIKIESDNNKNKDIVNELNERTICENSGIDIFSLRFTLDMIATMDYKLNLSKFFGIILEYNGIPWKYINFNNYKDKYIRINLSNIKKDICKIHTYNENSYSKIIKIGSLLVTFIAGYYIGKRK